MNGRTGFSVVGHNRRGRLASAARGTVVARNAAEMDQKML